jgi:hypothetical protein
MKESKSLQRIKGFDGSKMLKVEEGSEVGSNSKGYIGCSRCN